MSQNKRSALDFKITNRHRIYDLIYSNDSGISKPEIGTQLGLSLPTVISNVNQLIAEGLLTEGEMLSSTGGRKAVAIHCSKDARYAAGIDITLRHVSLVLVNILGEPVSRLQVRKSFSNTPAYYQELGQIMNQMIESACIKEDAIIGTGISVPGIVTEDGQMLLQSHVLQQSVIPCSVVGRGFPGKTILCNDANAAGIAEMWNENHNTALYMSLSDSVGGAVIMNHELYKGQQQRAGEFGHMTLVRDGTLCYCGKKGCVDAYCCTRVLSQYTDGDLHQFFQELHNGNTYLIPVWEKYLSHLATTVNNLLTAWDCSIIIGGYLGEYMDEYIDRLRQMVSELTLFPGNEDYITVCKYKKEAAAVGAALLWIQDFIHSI